MRKHGLAAQTRLLSQTSVVPGDGTSSTLMVLLHGYTLDGDSLNKVVDALRTIQDFKGADLLKPNMPLDTFSMASSSRITAELIGNR